MIRIGAEAGLVLWVGSSGRDDTFEKVSLQTSIARLEHSRLRVGSRNCGTRAPKVSETLDKCLFLGSRSR